MKDLRVSAETGCVLKFNLRDEKNPVITAVEKVFKSRILLKPTCLYGYPLRKRSISLQDIEAITRYKTSFDNPLFQKLRFVRNNIVAIRKNIGPVGLEFPLPRGTH